MLFGKTILVTGVASGIGARTAELASQLGADVIGVDIQPRRARSATSSRPMSARRRASPGWSTACRRGWTRSATSPACPARAGSRRRWRSTSTACALTEALAPRLREGGAVVNAASIAGFGWRANLSRAQRMVEGPGFPADLAALAAKHEAGDEIGYPLSKELLLLWTFRAAHQPLFKARGIRVNAVSPGPVETPILTQFRAVLGDARVDGDIGRVGRAGTAGDIAPAIAFLCSDGARWINGVNLPVDGGLEASVNADALGFAA